MPNRQRGIILFIVMSIIIVVIVLATVVLRITLNQSRLTHHQVSRIKAYYADKAGMNLAFYKLRVGTWSQHATGINYYCINGKVDAPVTCLDTITDTAIPYNVQIAVHPQNDPGINNTAKIDVKCDYSYTIP